MLTPYPSYKPSGIEWLENIPAHWHVGRLKFSATARTSNVDKHTKEDEVPVQLCNYVDVYNNELINDDVEFMQASATPSEITALRPMLAVSGGRFIMLSTPNGRRGCFYDAWSGDDEWRRIEVKATECPRIPAAFLEEERQAHGDLIFSQEYNCEFVATVDQFFGEAAIERAFAGEPLLQRPPAQPADEAPMFARRCRGRSP
jgi:hypothetical protein